MTDRLAYSIPNERGFWHYCLCEPAIVLAAWAAVDESGGVLSVINGEWYSYVVLPQP